MLRALFGEYDWSYYYSRIEAAERAYRSYNVDDKHNLHLISHWEKCISDAHYYNNKTTTQEGVSNVSKAREDFLEKQKQLVQQAKSQDHAPAPGMYGSYLKAGLK